MSSRSVVFADADPSAIESAIKADGTKVLLAWFTNTGLVERVIWGEKGKRAVLAWFSNSVELLKSIPAPEEEPGACRPHWEMSVYAGDGPWSPSAKRILIYNKASLSHASFREIETIFMEMGKQASDAEPPVRDDGTPATQP